MNIETPAIIQSARNTLQIAIDALYQLQQTISDDFTLVVNHLWYNKGRIVVTGIGKSAIIAQKMVATFNSTGTPALFMHAADAIHGDLGMITDQDSVLCISKSGETPEIKTLLPLLKNRTIPIIALTANNNSYLAFHADFVLHTPIKQEACPHNLAPTTSTTLQMVVGDMLAVALLEQRGFSSDDFARFHPGGALGKQLYLTVDEIYRLNDKPQILPNADFNEVVLNITQHLLGATVVVDNHQQVLGIITDGDLRRALLHSSKNIRELDATALMTPNPHTLPKGTLAIEAWQLMRNRKITQVIIINEHQQYEGIIHIHNLAREGFA
ncbi:MAG: KpsF/GutQ family sugar-phosphate isomerase [Chitinophagales bacterium]|jgi:arabinose-5-phosphate isomerase|nr:KpsF/GutQ family sugar-phosphate isomerase [Chitinophagales bacterium]